MKRTWIAVSLVAAALLGIGPDVDACGDKSLSAGGIRWQRALAARYPASVLAYVPAPSRLSDAKRELKLEETLNRVGHTYHEVASLTALQDSLATGQFNVVLADFADIGAVQRSLEASQSPVVLVPVAYNLTKAEARHAAKQYRFLITVPSRAAQYLVTLGKAVASKSADLRTG
jgi:hypothetical protein